jgi:hypothetical protein
MRKSCDHIIGLDEDRYEVTLSTHDSLQEWGGILKHKLEFCNKCGEKNPSYIKTYDER